MNKHKFISETAKACSVSQPTVSYAIKRLEEEFDVPLINRNKSHKEIELTTAGKTLLKHINTIFFELEEMSAELQLLKSTDLKLGLSPTARLVYFKDVDFSKLLNNSTLHGSIIENASLILKEKLINNELQIAFFASSKKLTSEKYIIQELVNLPYVVSINKNHPLAHKKSISINDLIGEELVIFNDNFVQNTVLDQIQILDKNQLNIVLEVNDLYTFSKYISEDNKIGFSAYFPVACDNNVIIPIEDISSTRFYIYLAYAKYLESSDLITTLLSEVNKIFREKNKSL